jgi:hypothetical protein
MKAIEFTAKFVIIMGLMIVCGFLGYTVGLEDGIIYGCEKSLSFITTKCH